MKQGMAIIYIKHNNLSAGTRTFKPGTKGEELVPELKIVSDHIFVKTKANALTSEEFSEFIRSKDIREFYIAGADATACVKSTCFNMTKAGYAVHVISDCVTSYDLKKMPEMLAYTEDWNAARLLQKAEEILKGKYVTYCAFEKNCVVGEIMPVHLRKTVWSARLC